ncbi:L-proline glycine betaine ABC transport system permease protein ProV [Fulvivirga imtechensis AK7]|uniref:L-proline glycine betaine ABC transport system permease protein ProV n=1 Tax=Fulvivirga imtechensis AK7 TaxID=1237149 RepID=L8JQA5_9BACT|nr:L-proline glycine betaine ABC transport system permease protein ProV [Fulvivirga imtechensis AK7]
MIEVQSLTKTYGRSIVVDNVTFSVGRGEVLVLLGTSGSGKTTTLKMINGLVPKTTGTVVIEGTNTDQLKPVDLRRRIGYVIQNVGLFPHYTIAQNIGVVPELLGWAKSRIELRVEELMEMMGLSGELMNRKPAELSGGQQQRVGIARALAADPDLILLDEPFGALDPITRHELQMEFKRLEGALNKAMVLVTHDVTEAVILGDIICIMDEGKVQQLGPPAEIIFHPKTEFVRKFIGRQKLQLELSLITLSDLQRAAGAGEAEVEKDITLAEYMQTHEDHELLQMYFNYRKKIRSTHGAG